MKRLETIENEVKKILEKEPAPRGSKTGTQGLKGAKERAVIPEQLCDYIVEICEKEHE